MTAATTPDTDEPSLERKIEALLSEPCDEGDLVEASFALELVAALTSTREQAIRECAEIALAYQKASHDKDMSDFAGNIATSIKRLSFTQVRTKL